MATLDEITKEKERVGEALARVDAQREKLVHQLSELEAAERVLARFGQNSGNEGGRSAARTPAAASYGRKARWRQTRLIEPQRSGSFSGKRQDAVGNRRSMQRRSPEPCWRRDCPAQTGRSH